MNKLTICSQLSESFKKYDSKTAMSFVNDEGMSYADLESKIHALTGILDLMGVSKGDRVAIIGENSPEWGIAFLSVLFQGAVTVPVLPDFHVEEMISVLEHSDTTVVFASPKQLKRLEQYSLNSGKKFISLEELSKESGMINSGKLNQKSMAAMEQEISEEDLASIIYTSGTTGSSKGVMLTHKNIAWMVRQTLTIQDVNRNDRFLSMLPMSHSYENSLGFLLPLSKGATIYYLKKQPTPTVLIEALQKVRPTLLLTVPLIIEKIIRKQVLPKFTSNAVLNRLFHFKPTRLLLNRMAGKKLMKTFGGELRFFGIGGARLDPVIEKYLREAKFPYAIGYGLTECSPLLAGCNAKNTKWQSTGEVLEGVDLKIINQDPVTGEGEIVAKGPNIMQGYYKNPELSAEVFTEDGYFRTGDLGYIDKSGYLFIRGRLKNVILGTNGENIYPEEIEALLNGIEGIEESLVIEKQGKLVAMVNMNIHELENKMLQLNERMIRVKNDTIDEVLSEIQKFVNQRVNRFSRLQLVIFQAEPFEKTPTKKIKRYLYQSN